MVATTHRSFCRFCVAACGVVVDVERDADGNERVLRVRDARVRSCTSIEGLHLTIWSGTPLTSTRLWHAYWYLGYDVEPNCQPADTREGR